MNPELHRICTRLVAIEEERKALADEVKEIKDAAKANGFDPKLITQTVRLMMLDADKRRAALDQIELFDTYLAGVGLLTDRDEPDGDTSDEPLGTVTLSHGGHSAVMPIETAATILNATTTDIGRRVLRAAIDAVTTSAPSSSPAPEQESREADDAPPPASNAEACPVDPDDGANSGTNTSPAVTPRLASGVASGNHAPAARSGGDEGRDIAGQAGERRDGSASGPGMSREVVARPDTTGGGADAQALPPDLDDMSDVTGEDGCFVLPPESPPVRRSLDEIASGYIPATPRRVTDDDLDIPTFLRRGHPDCIVQGGAS